MSFLIKHLGKMPHKKLFQYGLVIAANLILFYLLCQWYQKNIHWQELFLALQLISGSAIMAALVLGIGILTLYGQRLAYLLNHKTKRPFWPSFWIISYGFGANNILPFRIGDALKIHFAKKYFNVPVTRLLLVNVMEKFFDLLALLIIGVWVAIIGSMAINKIHLLVIAAALALLLCGVILILALIQRDVAWVKNFRKHERIKNFITIFETLISNPNLIWVFCLTICIWAMTIGTMLVYYTIVFPNIDISLVDALALVFLSTLSLGIPSAPGSLGVFEAAVVFYLSTFLKIPAADALACAIVLHLVQAMPQILLMFASIVAGKWCYKNKITTL
jgi:glycosyltransferase 2 family protein